MTKAVEHNTGAMRRMTDLSKGYLPIVVVISLISTVLIGGIAWGAQNERIDNLESEVTKLAPKTEPIPTILWRLESIERKLDKALEVK